MLYSRLRIGIGTSCKCADNNFKLQFQIQGKSIIWFRLLTADLLFYATAMYGESPISCFFLFLEQSSHIYKWVCLSVGWSVTRRKNIKCEMLHFQGLNSFLPLRIMFNWEWTLRDNFASLSVHRWVRDFRACVISRHCTAMRAYSKPVSAIPTDRYFHRKRLSVRSVSQFVSWSLCRSVTRLLCFRNIIFMKSERWSSKAAASSSTLTDKWINK